MWFEATFNTYVSFSPFIVGGLILLAAYIFIAEARSALLVRW